MTNILFHDVKIWDASRQEPEPGMHVLIENDRIKEVSDLPISISEAQLIDGTNKTLMPGLIDAHCHVTMTEVHI